MPVSLLTDATPITITDDKLPGVEGGDPGTSYTVRQVLPSTAKVITKRHTKPGRGGERVDSVAVYEDLLDHALVGWSGILLNGEDAPCTRDNKLLLDGQRREAILLVAGLNRTDEVARDHSFRPPA